MTNQTNQREFNLGGTVTNKAVPGVVAMTLDANNNPQAISNNSPIAMIDAYQAPSTLTWNSSTALNTTQTWNTAGMDTVALTISPSGTFTAGTITFEVYDGAAWIAVKCARLSSYNTDSTFTLTGASLQGWTVPAAGYPSFRVRLSQAITGTSPSALITAIVSSAPDTSICTVGLDPLQSSHPGVLTPQAYQFVTVGASSVQSSAVQALTNRVVLCSTTGAWIAIGSSPTATAGAGSFYLPPNVYSPPIYVVSGTSKIAALQASAAGSLSIIETL